jgi:methionine biosynthesis protein MetW
MLKREIKVNKYYDNYWENKIQRDNFWKYERNWVLPELFSKGEKVLDLGCGDGAVGEYLYKEKNAEVIAADFSKQALLVARERGLKTVILDVQKKLPFDDNSFDMVFWGDNAEHLFNPQITLHEIYRVLRKEGRLIMSCPNIGYWRYRLFHLFTGSLPDTEWSGNAPWMWHHIRFFNIQIINKFLSSENFEVKKIIGVSRRLPDKVILPLFKNIFGMILVVEAKMIV